MDFSALTSRNTRKNYPGTPNSENITEAEAPSPRRGTSREGVPRTPGAARVWSTGKCTLATVKYEHSTTKNFDVALKRNAQDHIRLVKYSQ